MSLLLLFSGGGASANTYTYQWQDSADGSTGWANLAGQTANSYVIAGAELRKFLRCNVTATGDGVTALGAATAPSNTVGPVQGVAPPPLHPHALQRQRVYKPPRIRQRQARLRFVPSLLVPRVVPVVTGRTVLQLNPYPTSLYPGTY